MATSSVKLYPSFNMEQGKLGTVEFLKAVVVFLS